MQPWPFPVQNLYIPTACNARQMELLSKARLVHADVHIGHDSPVLHISAFHHPEIEQDHAPSSKWLAQPNHYPMPCVIHNELEEQEYLLIASGQGQLFWRCRSRDYIEFALKQGAQWAGQSGLSLGNAG